MNRPIIRRAATVRPDPVVVRQAMPAPPPQSSTEETSDEDEVEPGNRKIHILFVGLIIALLIGGAIYKALIEPGQKYKADYITLTATRATEFAPYELDVEKNLGEATENYRMIMLSGRGLKVVFKTADNEDETFEAIKPSKDADSDTKVRGPELQNGKNTLITKLTGLNGAKSRKYIVMFDDTITGAGKLLPMLKQRFADLGIDERVAAGDTATVFFHKLSARYFYNGTKLVIQGREAPEKYTEKVEEALKALTKLPMSYADHPQKSELSAGIWNFLREDKVDERTTILVISDGLENSEVVSLERDEPIKKLVTLHKKVQKAEEGSGKRTALEKQLEEAASEVRKQLEETVQAPDGNGAKIVWWLPPRSSKVTQMKVAVEFVWLPLLDEHKYKAEMHF